MTKSNVDKTDTDQLFRSSLLSYDGIEEIRREEVLEPLMANKFVCLRGILSPARVRRGRETFEKRFSKKDDHPTIGESPLDVQNNFQKLSIGSARGKHHLGSYGRLLRVFFNPLWREDIYQMHDIFKQLIALRNMLLDKPQGFASDKIEQGLWTAARIHQYPVGGGFLQEHRDNTQAAVSEKAYLNYFQVFAILSQKGEDFETGGGFVEHEGKRIVIDDYISPGDIVIYDGSTLHGVEDIDPHKVLDLNSTSGRLAAFVSLYKDLSS